MSSFLLIFFIAFNLNATETSRENLTFNRERLQGLDEYKAQKALEQSEAERARRSYVQSQERKVKSKDREATPQFRQWQAERERIRREREKIRKNEAARSEKSIRDRDSEIIVPQSQRIDPNNRALFNSSKSLTPKSQGGLSAGSSGASGSGYGGGSDFSPPPPPPPPSYGNTFAPPAPDIYEPDPNGAPFEPQMGDEIPPPIFDEADF